MMVGFRENPPASLNGSPVVAIRDYSEQMSTECLTGKKTPLDLPKSNVLQFLLEDGSKISVRPSGTEPKIKFYFSVFNKLEHREDYQMIRDRLKKKILAIQGELELL